MIPVDTSIWIDHFRTHDRHLFGLGIGYVDAHLLAATMLTTGAKLWTRDKRLAATAAQHGLAQVDV